MGKEALTDATRTTSGTGSDQQVCGGFQVKGIDAPATTQVSRSD
jgi:hypothetical protein